MQLEPLGYILQGGEDETAKYEQNVVLMSDCLNSQRKPLPKYPTELKPLPDCHTSEWKNVTQGKSTSGLRRNMGGCHVDKYLQTFTPTEFPLKVKPLPKHPKDKHWHHFCPGHILIPSIFTITSCLTPKWGQAIDVLPFYWLLHNISTLWLLLFLHSDCSDFLPRKIKTWCTTTLYFLV